MAKPSHEWREWRRKPLELIIQSLEDPDDNTRHLAFSVFTNTWNSEEQVVYILNALKDKCWEIRALALHQFYDMAWNDDEKPFVCRHLEEIVKMLSDERDDIVIAAANTLGLLGPMAKTALTALNEIGSNSGGEVLQEINKAIAAINGEKVDFSGDDVDFT